MDYTEIRNDRIRSKICALMSEMLDNPDEHGIYPTSKFMWEMETFILAENETLKGLIKMALDELGVPNKDYLAPVTNAVGFLNEALKEPKLCICCEEITEENAHLHRNCGK